MYILHQEVSFFCCPFFTDLFKIETAFYYRFLYFSSLCLISSKASELSAFGFLGGDFFVVRYVLRPAQAMAQAEPTSDRAAHHLLLRLFLRGQGI